MVPGFQGNPFQILTQIVDQKEQNQVTQSELETLTEFMRNSTSENKQTLAAIEGVNSKNEEKRVAALRALPLLGKFTQL